MTKKIYASFFKEKVEDGPIKFLVTDAEYGEIHSRKSNKNYDVIDINVDVTPLDNPSSEKENIMVRIFEDYTPRSFFHQFVMAVLEGTQTTAFELNKIIGARGDAILQHFQPSGSEFNYPQIIDWKFYAPNKKVNEALSKYTGEGFDLEEEDIDFEDPIGNVQDENDHKEAE